MSILRRQTSLNLAASLYSSASTRTHLNLLERNTLTQSNSITFDCASLEANDRVGFSKGLHLYIWRIKIYGGVRFSFPMDNNTVLGYKPITETS